MKLLPCPHASCRAARRWWALDRGGMAYYSERYPGPPGDSFRYVCHGCGRLCEITAEGFAGVPEATVDDLRAAGALDHLTKDLRVAAGVTPAQAADLFAWGLRHPREVAEILQPREGLDAREVPDASS